MKITASLFTSLLLLLSVPSAFPAPRRRRPAHPEMCAIHSVFVQGNSESANDVRSQLEKRTWLKLANSPNAADAVMQISESRSEKNFPIRVERTTVSAQITKPGGALLWSGSSSFGEGAFNSGAGSAAKILLSHLQKDAGCAR